MNKNSYQIGSGSPLATYTIIENCVCGNRLLDPTHSCPEVKA